MQITRGKYAPKSRSPDVPSIIMIPIKEGHVMHVVHPVCCGIDGPPAQLSACLRRVSEDGTIHTA
jgi:hypothetical protein